MWNWVENDRVGYVLLAAIITGACTWVYILYRLAEWAIVHLKP